MKWKIEHQEKKLDALFSYFDQVQDDELRAYLSKFLCVRASGFVESSLKNLIYDYIEGTSPKAVQKFTSNKIRLISNLNFNKLVTVLSSFNDDWAKNLKCTINDEQKAALNSVVSNRNNIAHGENDNISYDSMKNYYRNIKEVVGHLKIIIKK